MELSKVLDELERLEKAATPGPWSYGRGCCGPYLAAQVREDERCGPDPLSDYDGKEPLLLGGDISDDDLALIAFLRTHAPTLIAAARETDRLKKKIEREPVWFIPGKIVAHAGRCFKLRVDDDGPRIVIEKVASVSCRSGEVTPTPEPQICTRCKRPIHENGGGMCFGCAELTD